MSYLTNTIKIEESVKLGQNLTKLDAVFYTKQALGPFLWEETRRALI